MSNQSSQVKSHGLNQHCPKANTRSMFQREVPLREADMGTREAWRQLFWKGNIHSVLRSADMDAMISRSDARQILANLRSVSLKHVASYDVGISYLCGLTVRQLNQLILRNASQHNHECIWQHLMHGGTAVDTNNVVSSNKDQPPLFGVFTMSVFALGLFLFVCTCVWFVRTFYCFLR